jgi:hypothetical protein
MTDPFFGLSNHLVALLSEVVPFVHQKLFKLALSFFFGTPCLSDHQGLCAVLLFLLCSGRCEVDWSVAGHLSDIPSDPFVVRLDVGPLVQLNHLFSFHDFPLLHLDLVLILKCQMHVCAAAAGLGEQCEVDVVRCIISQTYRE